MSFRNLYQTIHGRIHIQRRLPILVLLGSFIFEGCSKDLVTGITIGYSPPGVPLELKMSKDGFTLEFDGKIHTPIGTISIENNFKKALSQLNKHATYVEIINRRKNEKIVFVLKTLNDSLIVNTAYSTSITVVNRLFYTLVTIDAEGIEKYLHITPQTPPKPPFPNTPVKYFILTRHIISLDWSIHSIADILADLIFIVFLIITIIIDLILIIILFILRLVWFMILIIFYIL